MKKSILGLLLVAQITCAPQVMAQSATKDENLPVLTSKACRGVEGLRGIRVLSDVQWTGSKFNSDGSVVGWTPRNVRDALKSRKTDFQEIFGAFSAAKVLPKPLEETLHNLSREAQKFVEASFSFDMPQDRGVTCLVRFATNARGDVVWSIFYILLTDSGALLDRPAFSLDSDTPDSLSVALVGAAIDRTKVTTLTAIGQGAVDSLGFGCSPLTLEQVPRSERQ